MGTITVSLSEDAEEKLRRLASMLFGARKGAISKTIEMLVNGAEKIIEERKIDLIEELERAMVDIGGTLEETLREVKGVWKF